MKFKLALSALLVSGAIVGVTFADSVFSPDLVIAPVEKVYAPLGFDDNDNVELVLHGHFFNSCLKVGPASAKVNQTNKTITVSAQSWSYYHQLCEAEEMYTPFTQTVQLGLLTPGSYTVKVEGRADVQTMPLVVGASTVPTPDDYLYAPVEELNVSEDPETLKVKITLTGTFAKLQNSCMVLNRVETKFTSGNVVVVLPIAERLTGEACESASLKFQETVELPGFEQGSYLFHVRVLNGQSLNRVYMLGY